MSTKNIDKQAEYLSVADFKRALAQLVSEYKKAWAHADKANGNVYFTVLDVCNLASFSDAELKQVFGARLYAELVQLTDTPAELTEEARQLDLFETEAAPA